MCVHAHSIKLGNSVLGLYLRKGSERGNLSDHHEALPLPVVGTGVKRNKFIAGGKFDFTVDNRICFYLLKQAAKFQIRLEFDIKIGDVSFGYNNPRGNIDAINLVWCIEVIKRMLFKEMLVFIPNQIAEHEPIIKIVAINNGIPTAEIGVVPKIEEN